MRKIKIVVLDDENSALELLVLYVKRLGNTELVAQFNNPEEFLAWESKHTYDLLISDVDMPQMSGIEVSRKISKPVIFTSGKFSRFADPLSVADVLQDNILGQVPKPIRSDLLEKAIGKFAFRLELNPIKEFIKLKAKEDYALIRISDIQMVSTRDFENKQGKVGGGNKVVYRENGRPIIITDISLDDIFKQIANPNFMIVSDSCLIQKKAITGYSKSEIWINLNIEKEHLDDVNRGCRIFISDYLKQGFQRFLDS